ncbi:MAG TPA: hypothetical protein VGZ29_11230 [Terriglobia bacterium]|nr:hypothetical protein [Terriglobia bacterium]
MPLRKSPTLSPSRLEANRRNAQKSTGPRTALGKRRSRLNGLRHGGRSAIRRDLLVQVMDAPPGELDEFVESLFTSDLVEHPAIASLARLFGITQDNARRAEADGQCKSGGTRVGIPSTNQELADAGSKILAPGNPLRFPHSLAVAFGGRGIEAEENDERSQKVLQNQRRHG